MAKTKRTKSKSSGKTSRFRQNAKSEDLQKRTSESYSSKDFSGKYKDFLKEKPRPIFKPKEGDHIIDIIPFLAGSNHPKVKEGEPCYNVDLFVHMNVGVNEDQIVCPSQTFGKPCPVCERKKYLQSIGEYDDDKNPLYASRRVLYYVVVYDDAKEEAKGVQIWHASHHLAEKQFVALSKNKRDGGYRSFSDPDTGKSIEFSIEGKGRGTTYTGVQLVDRDEPISDDILDQCEVPLDEIIEVLSYDEIMAKLEPLSDHDSSSEEDEEEEDCVACEGSGKNSKGRKCRICGGSGKKPVKDEEPEDEEPEDEEENPECFGDEELFDPEAEECSECECKDECEAAVNGEEEEEEEEEEEPLACFGDEDQLDPKDKVCKKCKQLDECKEEVKKKKLAAKKKTSKKGKSKKKEETEEKEQKSTRRRRR